MDVDQPDILRAWRSASQLIINSQAGYILTVKARSGIIADANQLRALDQKAIAAGAERPSSVANMLFPSVAFSHPGTVAQAKSAALRLLGRGRRRGQKFSNWKHTYFERLVGTYMPANGVPEQIGDDKLSALIDKLANWPNDVQAALYIHNSMPSDTFRVRGSPCLQYIQFRPHSGNRLDLVALYRSHDYSAKALGNLVGLQRLGRFVARHSGRVYESTQVISLHPHLSLSKAAQQNYADNII